LLTGCNNKRIAPVLQDIIQTEYFRVVVVDDVDTVEVCGALKVMLRGFESL
jgi:glycerol-3-phosphate dehydrogenase (NAD+)